MELIGNISHLFFDKILWNAVFPTSIILIIFSFYSIDYFRKNKLFVFYFVASLTIILVRSVGGVLLGGGNEGGWNCESRRFYAIAAVLIPFSVAGFPLLVDYTYCFLKKIFGINISHKNVIICLIIIFSIICVGKALSPQSYKNYIHEPNALIEENTPAGAKKILISNDDNFSRKRYYIKADVYIKYWDPMNINKLKKYLKIASTYRLENYCVYFFVDNTNNVFDKFIKSKKNKFSFIELHEWKNGQYTLYKYVNNNNYRELVFN